MKTNYTPGPWKVMYSTPQTGESALAVWPDQTVEGTVGSPICKVSPEHLENETDRANARLIAAAPELFDALRQILFMSDPGSYENAIVDMKAIAGKAITKATGEKEQVS